MRAEAHFQNTNDFDT